jgi:hypothetical protein
MFIEILEKSADSTAKAKTKQTSNQYVCPLLLASFFLPTLKMEAVYSSETLVDSYPTTRRYILEDSIHNHCCVNLISN